MKPFSKTYNRMVELLVEWWLKRLPNMPPVSLDQRSFDIDHLPQMYRSASDAAFQEFLIDRNYELSTWQMHCALHAAMQKLAMIPSGFCCYIANCLYVTPEGVVVNRE